MLLAAGLSIFLIAQWFVIFAGTTGLLPLTGVVVPYLSWGKTGMIVFMLTAAMIARLAESGHARESTTELDEVRKGTMATLAGELLLLAGGVVVIFLEAVVWGPATTVRGCVTLLAAQPGDPYDRIVNLHDPRLQIIADRMKRGEILDRNGEKVAGTDPETGERTYPLGDAMGTLIGPAEAIVLRPEWMLERQLDGKLRGYGDLDDGPAVWMAEKAGRRRALPVRREVARSQAGRPRPGREDGRGRRGAAARPGFPGLPAAAPLHACEPGDARRRLYDDIPSRTTRITIDAKLQTHVSGSSRRRPSRARRRPRSSSTPTPARSSRARKWPDFDPGNEKFMRRLTDPDFPVKDKKFTGVYGPWRDKTGVYGVFQAGSVAKVVTSLAAARAGLLGSATARVAKTGPIFGCTQRDGQGPYFTRPGWYKAIHDHPEDPIHGNIDYIKGHRRELQRVLRPARARPGSGCLHQPRQGRGRGRVERQGDQPGQGGQPRAGGDGVRPGGGAAQRLAARARRRHRGRRRHLPEMRAGHGPQRALRGAQDPGRAQPRRPHPLRHGAGRAGGNRARPAEAGGRSPLRQDRAPRTPSAPKDESCSACRTTSGARRTRGSSASRKTNTPEPDQAITPHRIVPAVVVPRGGLGARVSGPGAMEILAAAQSLGYITPKPGGAGTNQVTPACTGRGGVARAGKQREGRRRFHVVSPVDGDSPLRSQVSAGAPRRLARARFPRPGAIARRRRLSAPAGHALPRARAPRAHDAASDDDHHHDTPCRAGPRRRHPRRPHRGREGVLSTGDRVGDWVVDDRLGEGGMGAVYRVHSMMRRTACVAALKILKPTADGEARVRFIREARP
jgi:hypothetical protein